MSSLEERMASGNTTLTWRPGEKEEEGNDVSNPLFGKFLRMEAASTQRGPCWIMVLAKTDGQGTESGEEVAVWLFHTVLKNELKRAAPRVGDLIAVRKDGKKESNTPGNSAMQLYTVKVDKPQAQDFNWAALDGNEEDLSGKVVYPDAPPPTPPAASEPSEGMEGIPVPAAEDDDIPF